MIRRKRQFVDVAGIMVMPYSFSMSPSRFHADHRHNDGHCWTSQQWHPAQLRDDNTVLIGTYGDHSCDKSSGEPLAKSHAYVVTSVETEPDEKIELDNPWHGGQRITWIAKDRLSEEVKTVYVLD